MEGMLRAAPACLFARHALLAIAAKCHLCRPRLSICQLFDSFSSSFRLPCLLPMRTTAHGTEGG